MANGLSFCIGLLIIELFDIIASFNVVSGESVGKSIWPISPQSPKKILLGVFFVFFSKLSKILNIMY